MAENVFTSAPPPSEPPKPATKGEKAAKPAVTSGETPKPSTDTTVASPTEKPSTSDTKAGETADTAKSGVHGNHLALVLVSAVVLVLLIALWRMSPMAALFLLALILAALLIHLWRRWLHRRRGGDAAAKKNAKNPEKNAAREHNRRHLWPFDRNRRSPGGTPGNGPGGSGPGGPGAGPKGAPSGGRRWPWSTRKNAADKPEAGKKATDPTGKNPTIKKPDSAGSPTGTPEKKPTGRRWPWSTKNTVNPGANGGPGGGPGKGATTPNSPTGKGPNGTNSTATTTPPGSGRRWPWSTKGTRGNNAGTNAATTPPSTKVNPGPKATPPSSSPTGNASAGPTKRRWWQRRSTNASTSPTTPPPPMPAGIPLAGPPPPPAAPPRQRWWNRRRNATTPSGDQGGPAPTTTVTLPPHRVYTPDPPSARSVPGISNIVNAEVIPNPPTTGHRWTGTHWTPVTALPASPAPAGTAHTGSNTMGTATPIQDASTTATRTDAYSTAESTAVSSARNLTEQARDARAEAGRLSGVPDMAPAADRLNQEATNLERTAETRNGLARGYAALRNLVSSRS
jgi:hypothetical protein